MFFLRAVVAIERQYASGISRSGGFENASSSHSGGFKDVIFSRSGGCLHHGTKLPHPSLGRRFLPCRAPLRLQPADGDKGIKMAWENPHAADARGFPPFFALWRYNASIICPGQASVADFFRGRPEINLCVVSLSNTLITASNDSALLVKVTALSRAIFTKRGSGHIRECGIARNGKPGSTVRNCVADRRELFPLRQLLIYGSASSGHIPVQFSDAHDGWDFLFQKRLE